jgi:hypothetical protein
VLGILVRGPLRVLWFAWWGRHTVEGPTASILLAILLTIGASQSAAGYFFLPFFLLDNIRCWLLRVIL